MILQIRATSGGGKTTLVRALYKAAKCKPVKAQRMTRGGKKTLLSLGDWNGTPVYIVGPYDGVTGGCDRIATIEEVIKLVDYAAARTQGKDNLHHTGIVLFEGLLLAHSWGAMGEFLHEKYGPRYINAFILTDMETCYDNVLKRRDAGGADNSDEDRIIKIRKNVYDDFHRVELAYTRVLARGGQRIDLPYGELTYKATADYLDEWILLYSGNP